MLFIDGYCILQTAREKRSLTRIRLLNPSIPSVVLGQPVVLPSISARLGGLFYLLSFKQSVPVACGPTGNFSFPVTAKWFSQAHCTSSCFQVPDARETVENNSQPYAQHFLLTDFPQFLHTAGSSGELKGQVSSYVCEELNSFLSHTCLKTDCLKKKTYQ